MEDFGNQYKDSSSAYIHGEIPPLPPEFDSIIKSLDKERASLYKKDKGLFKKSFFIIWPSVIAITAILVFIFSGDTAIIFGVGGFLGAFISAIAAFIYKLLAKAKTAEVFMPKLKKELVGKILKFVNSNLSFFAEGISIDDFNKAGLIIGSNFKSEDSIKGKINGKQVIISECKLIRNRSNTANAKNLDVKSKNATVVSFNGIFIQLELSSINLSTPIKVIPTFALEHNFNKVRDFNPLSQTRFTYKRIDVEDEDIITIPSSLQKSAYEFFCKDKQVVDLFVNQPRLKVLDFIFDKYKDERESWINNQQFLIDIDAKSGVYLSIVNNTLYMALDWNEDLFEADVLLKEGIEETSLAQKIHRDLIFINQIINEVSLLDKING